MMKRKHVIISSLLIVAMLFLLPACGMRSDENNADAGKNDTVVSDSADNMQSGNQDDTLKNGAEDIADGTGDVTGAAAEGVKEMTRDLTDGVEDGLKDLEKVSDPSRPPGTQ